MRNLIFQFLNIDTIAERKKNGKKVEHGHFFHKNIHVTVNFTIRIYHFHLQDTHAHIIHKVETEIMIRVSYLLAGIPFWIDTPFRSRKKNKPHSYAMP